LESSSIVSLSTKLITDLYGASKSSFSGTRDQACALPLGSLDRFL
jgi:hypothetical protein